MLGNDELRIAEVEVLKRAALLALAVFVTTQGGSAGTSEKLLGLNGVLFAILVAAMAHAAAVRSQALDALGTFVGGRGRNGSQRGPLHGRRFTLSAQTARLFVDATAMVMQLLALVLRAGSVFEVAVLSFIVHDRVDICFFNGQQ